jgi:hypothetical protein
MLKILAILQDSLINKTTIQDQEDHTTKQQQSTDDEQLLHRHSSLDVILVNFEIVS